MGRIDLRFPKAGACHESRNAGDTNHVDGRWARRRCISRRVPTNISRLCGLHTRPHSMPSSRPTTKRRPRNTWRKSTAIPAASLARLRLHSWTWPTSSLVRRQPRMPSSGSPRIHFRPAFARRPSDGFLTISCAVPSSWPRTRFPGSSWRLLQRPGPAAQGTPIRSHQHQRRAGQTVEGTQEDAWLAEGNTWRCLFDSFTCEGHSEGVGAIVPHDLSTRQQGRDPSQRPSGTRPGRGGEGLTKAGGRQIGTGRTSRARPASRIDDQFGVSISMQYEWLPAPSR